MNFTFTEDQTLFRKMVHDLLQKECPEALVRASWSNEIGMIPGLWARLADLGVLGVTISEAHDGLGMNELDLVLLLEEAGRFALPDPLLETTAVGAPLLHEVGSPELQERWLPKVSSGEAILA